MGQDVPISEKGDLSFLLFLSKQCLVENIQRKFQKNSSVTLISAKSPSGFYWRGNHLGTFVPLLRKWNAKEIRQK